uniref:THAP-type domain-containing protein n=1 Tax=Neogobius melanostomus TaxID=47308 RepID=A0A8C6TJE4_9GOBI
MPSCSAINCAKRSVRTINKSNTINFCVIRFSFPLGDKTRLAQWVHKVKRKDWVPNMNSRLCASHFAEECFVITGGKKHLTPTAVPTIFDFSLKGKCMTAQEKPGNDASTTPIAPPPPDIQPTTSKEHNYTVSRSPKSIKRQMETQLISVEERLDHCRKKLKTEQLKTWRLKKQVNCLVELLRNTLADGGTLQTPTGKIQWKYLVELNKLQEKEGLR